MHASLCTSLHTSGEHLDTLKPPLQLSFGLREGSEVVAPNLRLVNSTHALATLPPFRGITYYAKADVMLSDSLGRTAYMLAAMTIVPSPLECVPAPAPAPAPLRAAPCRARHVQTPRAQPRYAATACLVLLLVLLSACAVPAYLRAGCEGEVRPGAKAASGSEAERSAGKASATLL